MSLGQKIRELRIAKGFTQSDLGSGLVTPSMISQIESDKANPSYKVLEAIAEKLETPLEHFLADIQTQLEQTSAHKVAKALLASNNHERAIGLLENLVNRPSPSLNLLDVQSDLGECYMQLERFDDAVDLYEQVLDTAKKKESIHSMLDALNKLGTIEMKRQKYHKAIFHWRKAYEMFEHLPAKEPYLQSTILTNLGNIHHQLGEFDEAVQHFHEAYKLLSNSSHFEQIGMTYMGLGLSYRKIREFEKAAEYSQYAIAIFESLKNVKLSIDVKRNYGILKGEEGALDEALQIFTACMDEYERNGHTAEIAVTRGEIARIWLREQKIADAKLECEKALSLISNTTREAAPILRTLAVAEDNLGQLDKAIQYMERAREAFERHHLLSELAETYSLLGDFYQKKGCLMQANDCLQKMKQALTQNLKERGIIL